MSHFAVLVIGDDHEKQLAPYHEFECTGHIDEYVQSIDETEEARKNYDEKTETRIKDLGGNLHYRWDDQFYREPTPEEEKKHGRMGGTGCGGGIQWTSKDWGDGRGYRAKVHFIPDGYEEIEIPTSELMTFREWVEDYFERPVIGPKDTVNINDEDFKWGWIRADGENVIEVIDRTNPEAKWDWYQVGGRYRGWFPIKDGVSAVVGKAGVFDNEAEPQTSDQVKIRDIDFERAFREVEAEANERFDEWESLFIVHGKGEPWSHFLALAEDDGNDITIEKARELYHDQPLKKATKESETFRHSWGCLIEDMGFDREAYVKNMRNSRFTPFAVVKDGKWYERGKMGWWACVSDEKEIDDWNAECNKLLEGLEPDTILTLVDCHI